MPTIKLRGRDGLMAALTDKTGPERWECQEQGFSSWNGYASWSHWRYDYLTNTGTLWRRRSALESIEVPQGITVSDPDEQGDVHVSTKDTGHFVMRRAPVALYEIMAAVARALREDSESGNG